MKPASAITDRAKRYRANQETSDWPKVCMFCGSTKDLQVDHLDGFEENGEPENLLMLCRSCNQLKSAVYKKAGLGRRTVQYNPGVFSSLFGPHETYRTTGGGHPDFQRKLKQERADAKAREREDARRERAEEREMEQRIKASERERWKEAKAKAREEVQGHLADMRREKQEAAQAKRAERAAAPKSVGRYKGFTIYKRGAGDDRVFYSTMDPDTWLDSTREVKKLIDTFKNPAPSLSGWREATAILRGDATGSPFKAARTIRSTPIARRYAYLDQAMRRNPDYPTFAQYAWAVSQHTRGAHDEGGAIIHATPEDLRHEYADKIARIKRGRGTMRKSEEVPF